jgi:hypothetical protein
MVPDFIDITPKEAAHLQGDGDDSHGVEAEGEPAGAH